MKFFDLFCKSPLLRTSLTSIAENFKLTIKSFFFTFGLFCFAFLIGVYFELWPIAKLSKWASTFGLLSWLIALVTAKAPSVDYRAYEKEKEAGFAVMPPLVQDELDKTIGFQK